MKQPKLPRKLVPAKINQGSLPAEFGYTEAAAIQAFAAGTANDGQQKIAFRWILEGACGIGLWPYKESQRETDIALGRHFVGHQIMGLVKVNLSQLKKREESLNG